MLDWIAEGFRALVQLEGAANLKERRSAIRIECAYPVHLRSGDRELCGEVTNAGLAGLHLRLEEALKTGRGCTVWRRDDPETGAGAPCTVVWSRFSKEDESMTAGLQFDRDPRELKGSWVAPLFHELGFDDQSLYQRRLYLRADSEIPAATIYDERILPATIWNLGVGGALLESPCIAEPDEELEVVIGPEFGLEKLHLPSRLLRATGDDPREMSVEFSALTRGKVAQLGKYIHRALAAWR